MKALSRADQESTADTENKVPWGFTESILNSVDSSQSSPRCSTRQCTSWKLKMQKSGGDERYRALLVWRKGKKRYRGENCLMQRTPGDFLVSTWSVGQEPRQGGWVTGSGSHWWDFRRSYRTWGAFKWPAPVRNLPVASGLKPNPRWMYWLLWLKMSKEEKIEAN